MCVKANHQRRLIAQKVLQFNHLQSIALFIDLPPRSPHASLPDCLCIFHLVVDLFPSCSSRWFYFVFLSRVGGFVLSAYERVFRTNIFHYKVSSLRLQCGWATVIQNFHKNKVKRTSYMREFSSWPIYFNSFSSFVLYSFCFRSSFLIFFLLFFK